MRARRVPPSGAPRDADASGRCVLENQESGLQKTWNRLSTLGPGSHFAAETDIGPLPARRSADRDAASPGSARGCRRRPIVANQDAPPSWFPGRRCWSSGLSRVSRDHGAACSNDPDRQPGPWSVGSMSGLSTGSRGKDGLATGLAGTTRGITPPGQRCGEHVAPATPARATVSGLNDMRIAVTVRRALSAGASSGPLRSVGTSRCRSARRDPRTGGVS